MLQPEGVCLPDRLPVMPPDTGDIDELGILIEEGGDPIGITTVPGLGEEVGYALRALPLCVLHLLIYLSAGGALPSLASASQPSRLASSSLSLGLHSPSSSRRCSRRTLTSRSRSSWPTLVTSGSRSSGTPTGRSRESERGRLETTSSTQPPSIRS